VELNEILTIAFKAKGSDIHIKTGLPPIVRIDGRLHPIPNAPRLSPDFVAETAQSMMNDRQRRIFEENFEVDLAYAVPGLGRFRVSVYRQRGTVAMVFRSIAFIIPTLEGLNLD
jgi:twitching motility protein PilT